MQTAAFYPQPVQPLKLASADPLRASVGHLLSRAYGLPCSAAAQAFAQLVQSTSRFQLALDVLLPLLDSPVELPQRILVSYILYSLYAPHPIAINPFRSALLSTFQKERDVATQVANTGAISENEQLVWVLWKILKGDGSDIGPFTPSNLARSPVPPKLRAAKLTLDEESPVIERPKFDPFGDSDAPARQASFPGTEHEVSSERDRENERASQGLNLFLAARDRVLTLSEQRMLLQLIPQVTSPPMITSLDLPPLIANNPMLAHPIFAALLSQPLPPTSSPSATSPSAPANLDPYLEVLTHLPPTLPSFDLLGRLLRDPTLVPDTSTGGKTTVADLVRCEVLGGFVSECVRWVEREGREWAEWEGQGGGGEGLAGGGGGGVVAKAVVHLCRFYHSLIKLGLVDPASNAESAEMAHFALRHARFEEANALYRVLALGGSI